MAAVQCGVDAEGGQAGRGSNLSLALSDSVLAGNGTGNLTATASGAVAAVNAFVARHGASSRAALYKP